jgi:hypothetical protein
MSESDESYEDFSDPISLGARSLAIGLGIVFAGVGGVAVFIAKNDAGTVALLLVAAALLLIGIQGTPLVRLGSKDSNIQLATIRRRARYVIEEARQESEPEVADAIATAVESAISIPQPVPKIQMIGRDYERRIFDTLRQISDLAMGYYDERGDTGIDGVLTDQSGRRLGIYVKYRMSTRLLPHELLAAFGEAILAKEKNMIDAFLLVTNTEHSQRVDDYLRTVTRISPFPFEAVVWRDQSDNERLREAALRLLGEGG